MTVHPPLSNIPAMDAELASLEQKLDQLIRKCVAAQAENRNLREQVTTLENANRELTDKVGLASSRLEALLARIPEA